MAIPKCVMCIKDVKMDGKGRVFTAGKSYHLIGGVHIKTVDDAGQEHIIGDDFKDSWFLKHFKVEGKA